MVEGAPEKPPTILDKPWKEYSQLLTHCDDALQRQPGFPGGTLTQHKPNTTAFASRICSFCYTEGQAKKQTNVSDLLLQSFGLKHRNLSAEDCGTCEHLEHEALPAEDEGDGAEAPQSRSRKAACWEVGVCLCSEQGLQLYRLSGRFLQALKLQFPASGSFRVSLLKSSRIFLVLRSCAKEEVKDEKPQWLDTFVWHVGIMYLSPFRPTFREVTAVSDLDGHAVNISAGCVFFTFWPAMQKLVLDRAWFVSFFRLRESSKPLSAFDASKATIVPMQVGSKVQIWPPSRVRQAKKAHDHLDPDPDADDSEGGDADEVDAARDFDKLLDEGLAAIHADMDDQDQPAEPDGPDADDSAEHPGPGPGPDAAPEDPDADSNSSDSSTSIDLGSVRASIDLREGADVAVAVPGGVIRYYTKTMNFTATCNNPLHGKCVLTRKSEAYRRAAKSDNMAAKGRPLGFMSAWLDMGRHKPSKDHHWDTANYPDFHTRLVARLALSTASGGSDLLDKEREPRDGEGDEPTGFA